MNPPWDIAIIGAGAAGLTSAIFAKQTNPSLRVALIDSAKSIGAKILVSGGGRCNVTHKVVTPADYNGAKNVVRNVLAAFDVKKTVAWFESLGVKLKEEETGKLFPVSDCAGTVLHALVDRCFELGVTILNQTRVTRISPPGNVHDLHHLHHDGGVIDAHKLVLATGGRSLPKTGSDGWGWEMARSLGHTVTPTYPALVPLVLEGHFFHRSISGTAHEVELSTYASGKLIDRRTGSLLWTHFGISGPVVMDASRHWTIARANEQSPELRANLVPRLDFAGTEQSLVEQAKAQAKVSALRVLSERVPGRVAEALLKHVGVDAATAMGQLSREARRAIVQGLTNLVLPVEQDRGWNYAEVTAGGVPLAEIDYRTMQSRKVPGLYLVGEILDCDGRIGGFNFQWAWATGYLAGTACATV